MTQAVLLVDDNAVQAAIRQTILTRDGYDVYVALGPDRALDRFAAADFPVPVGLVLTDHLMPGMNGAEFIRRLRQLHPHMPVLVISGLEEAESEYAGLGVRFRTKPLLPEALLSLVHQMLDGDQASAGLPAA